MKLTKPHKLTPGDTIGIIAPSRHIFNDAKVIQRGITLLKKQGFAIKFASNYNKRLFSAAGTPQERARAVNAMFTDKKVKVILCALGGDAANQVLELLDYQMIKNNPKIIVGYSDNTHILLAIHAQTGLKVFHGPNITQLSLINKASQKQFFETVTGSNQTFNLFSKCKILKPGKASGKLLGGNLMVVNALLKTKYLPDLKNTILFWEEINEGTNAVGYQLHQLQNAGILKQLKGMVIGHITESKKDEDKPWKDTLLELTKHSAYPILKTDCFGHFAKTFYTFPIGGEATINTTKKVFAFEP